MRLNQQQCSNVFQFFVRVIELAMKKALNVRYLFFGEVFRWVIVNIKWHIILSRMKPICISREIIGYPTLTKKTFIYAITILN